MSVDKQKRIVQDYVAAQKHFDEEKKKFESVRKKFYSSCEDYYENNGKQKTYDFDGIVLTRVQNVSIKFDVDALEKVLSRSQRSSVIKRECSVNDIDGFIAYMKSIGADPKVVKSFIHVSKTVDEKELDQLVSVGEIDEDAVDGCYTVIKRDPYFKVREKDKSKDGEKREES